MVYSILENQGDFLVSNSIIELTLSLGLPRDLIRGFILISMALKSGLPLDPFLFGALCREVKQRYYEVVPWAYMSPTVHKASTLLHSIFIPSMALPVMEFQDQEYKIKKIIQINIPKENY